MSITVLQSTPKISRWMHVEWLQCALWSLVLIAKAFFLLQHGQIDPQWHRRTHRQKTHKATDLLRTLGSATVIDSVWGLFRTRSTNLRINSYLPVGLLQRLTWCSCRKDCCCIDQLLWTSDSECRAPSAHVIQQNDSRGRRLHSRGVDVSCLQYNSHKHFSLNALQVIKDKVVGWLGFNGAFTPTRWYHA